MGVTYTGAADGNIAFTASEAKTTEKKTSAFQITLQGEVYLNSNKKHILQLERSMSDTAGMVTVKVYNVSKIDGTNSRDTLFITSTVSTTTDYKSILLDEGLFLGTEGSIKLGAVFAANITGSGGAGNVYYRLYRT